jgi:hypothetical protein
MFWLKERNIFAHIAKQTLSYEKKTILTILSDVLFLMFNISEHGSRTIEQDSRIPHDDEAERIMLYPDESKEESLILAVEGSFEKKTMPRRFARFGKCDPRLHRLNNRTKP